MADNTVVRIGETSPEFVALQLLEVIAKVEERPMHQSEKYKAADREYILSTYRQCLMVVKGYPPEN